MVRGEALGLGFQRHREGGGAGPALGYFRLLKPIERRMYELARKHWGQQAQWWVSLSGQGNLRGFQTTNEGHPEGQGA